MRRTSSRGRTQRGVSPLVGVVLLVGITVIFAVVGGVFLLGLGPQQETPEADVRVDERPNGAISVTLLTKTNAKAVHVQYEGGNITLTNVTEVKTLPGDAQTLTVIGETSDGKRAVLETHTVDPHSSKYNINNTESANISIDNPPSRNLQQYQVKMTIPHRSAMQSDFDDIRFYQNSTPLDYWVKNYTSGTEATVFVKVDEIPASGTTITMEYGHQKAASADDPRAAMVIYDLHNGNGVVGTIKGDARIINKGETDEYVEITDTVQNQHGWIHYGFTPSPGFHATYQYYIANGTDADGVNIHAWSNSSGSDTSRTFEDPETTGVHWMMNDHDDCVGVTWNTQCGDIAGFSANPRTGNWESVTSWGVRDGSQLTYYHETLGQSVSGTWSDSSFPPGDNFGIGGRTGGKTNHHWVRNITVRKWVGQELPYTINW